MPQPFRWVPQQLCLCTELPATALVFQWTVCRLYPDARRGALLSAEKSSHSVRAVHAQCRHRSVVPATGHGGRTQTTRLGAQPILAACPRGSCLQSAARPV